METPITETTTVDDAAPVKPVTGKKRAKSVTKPTSAKPTQKAKAPSAKGGGNGTGVKRSAAPAARVDAPRPGSMGALVVDKTRLGWGVEAIAKAAIAAFPKTTRAKEFRDGNFYGIRWLQANARKHGWLPKAT